MINNLYAASFIISLILLVGQILYSSFNNHDNARWYTLIYTCIMLANLGCWYSAIAPNIETACFAVKIVYLGDCFLQLFIFILISKMCNVKLPLFCIMLMLGLSLSILFAVFGVGYNNLYYKSYELLKVGEYSHLKVYEFGFMHTVYLVMMFGEVLGQLIIIFASFSRRKVVSYKNAIFLIILESIGIFTYAIGLICNLKYDFVPFVYNILESMLFIIQLRFRRYGISNYIAAKYEDNKINGFVIFDKRKNYLGSDKKAKDFFPDLGDLQIDFPIPSGQTLLNEVFINHCDDSELVNNEFQFEKDEVHFKITRTILTRRDRIYGYLFEISDDTQQQKYIKLLNNYNSELVAAVDKAKENVLEIQQRMIYGFAEMVEEKDIATGGHIKRTSSVVGILAKKMELHPDKYCLNKRFYENVVKAAPLHDLGKIAVEDAVLRKPDKLDEDEFRLIQMHPLKGAEIIERVMRGAEKDDFVDISKNIALYHHEKWDGSGYPVGLANEAIPIEARMMALADVIDALLSRRPYKEPFSYDKAFSIIEESSGSHFDPELTKIFLSCKEEISNFYDEQRKAEEVVSEAMKNFDSLIDSAQEVEELGELEELEELEEA